MAPRVPSRLYLGTKAAFLVLVMLAAGCLSEPTSPAPVEGPVDEDPPVSGIGVASDGRAHDGVKVFTIAAVQPGVEWGDLGLSLNRVPLTRIESGPCQIGAGQWAPCRGGVILPASEAVRQGEDFNVHAGDGGRLAFVYAPTGREAPSWTVSS